MGVLGDRKRRQHRKIRSGLHATGASLYEQSQADRHANRAVELETAETGHAGDQYYPADPQLGPVDLVDGDARATEHDRWPGDGGHAQRVDARGDGRRTLARLEVHREVVCRQMVSGVDVGVSRGTYISRK